MRDRLNSPSVRPFLLLTVIVLAFCIVDWGHGRFVNRATVFIGPTSMSSGTPGRL